MDKVYRIKISNGLYVGYVIIDGNDEDNSLSMMVTYDINESALYDKDKAKIYCEELNNNRKYNDLGISFMLEEVE